MKESFPGTTEKNKIHVVYFSCSRHFEYLHASLASLRRLHSPDVGRIYLYIDGQDFLTPRQETRLNELDLGPTVRRCGKLSWGGRDLILTELKAFREIAGDMAPGDYLAKVDSDVYFLSNDIFTRVLGSDDLMLGAKETFWEPYVFIHGACYFLHRSLIPRLREFDDGIFSQTLDDLNSMTMVKYHTNVYSPDSCPEDVVMYKLVRRLTDQIRFLDLYGLDKSVVHFPNKREILEYHRAPAVFRLKRFYMQHGGDRICPQRLNRVLWKLYESFMLPSRETSV